MPLSKYNEIMSQVFGPQPKPKPTLVSFKLSGVAMTAACEGGWPNDNPRGATALNHATCAKTGYGLRYTVTMRRDDAIDLADYLQSVADVWASMTSEERGSKDRPQPIWKAIEGIRQAVKS